MLAAKIPKSVETDLSTDPYSSSYITFKKKTLFLEIMFSNIVNIGRYCIH